MNSVNDIIDGLGGNAKVAIILGCGPSVVSEFRRRKSIPLKYWPKLISASKTLSSEVLMKAQLEKTHTEQSA